MSKTGAAIERYFNVRPHQYKLSDRYNVAPSTDIPVIRLIDGERTLSLMRWGLISWAKDPGIGYKMINARAETVATKPAFHFAYQARRCLIPAGGFYEWKRDLEPRQPYYLHRRDGSPMGFAGLWETWKGEGETSQADNVCQGVLSNEGINPQAGEFQCTVRWS